MRAALTELTRGLKEKKPLRKNRGGAVCSAVCTGAYLFLLHFFLETFELLDYQLDLQWIVNFPCLLLPVIFNFHTLMILIIFGVLKLLPVV